MAPNRLATVDDDTTGESLSHIVSIGPNNNYDKFVEDTAASLKDGRIPKLPSAPLDQIFKRNMIPKEGLILDFGIGTGKQGLLLLLPLVGMIIIIQDGLHATLLVNLMVGRCTVLIVLRVYLVIGFQNK